MSSEALILFIVTNHNKLGNSNIPTGIYPSEAAHAYHVLSPHFQIVFASPKGGTPPLDPDYPSDPITTDFLNDKIAMNSLNNSIPLHEIKAKDYVGVFYPGGHGPMFDLANDVISQRITREIYEAGGIVGAVCHGPAGIVNVKLSNGNYLVSGKNVTGFTNDEEDETTKTKYMPFMLEDQLIKNQGIFTKERNWIAKVAVDGRLVTGQNPASATPTAQAMLKLLKKH